ncbi:hypothetical protein NL676_020424 [Syzygium grande]|nr:hypothetical protein NL676_020424 [Syzygium grande]
MDEENESPKIWKHSLEACIAEILLETSLQIIFLNKSFAATDTVLEALARILRFPLSTASKISGADLPWNGGHPTIITYNTAPALAVLPPHQHFWHRGVQRPSRACPHAIGPPS